MSSPKELIKRMLNVINGKSYTDLAKFLGVSRNTIDVWIRRGKIPEKNLIKFCQLTNVNFDWLLTGEGEMYKIPQVQNSIIAQGNNHKIIGNVVESNTNNELKELCEAFQKLPEKKRKYFYHLIMAEMYKEEE